jgi:lysophospholipase L1-like esterase
VNRLVVIFALGLGLSAHSRGRKPEESLATLATKLKAPGGEVDSACLEPSAGERCARHALTTFFAALERNTPETAPPETVRVVVLGNSLIATDGVVGVVREKLIERLGDGGRGQLLADRLGSWGPRVRTGHAKGKWKLSTVGMLQPLDRPHGLSGAQHEAVSRGASTQYELRGETRVEVLWSSETDAGLGVEVDGKRISAVAPLPDGKVQRTPLTLPATARVLRLVFDQPGPVVQGVVLERPGRGVVVDTLGVPSVDASLFLRTDETLFAEQLRARTPALVMVMLGGNEVKRLAWGRSELPAIEADLRALLKRTKAAVPSASCLVVSPIDSVRGRSVRTPFAQRPELEGYLALQKRIAKEESCAYFDLFSAMGGPGSLERFRARGLIHDDLVHPRGQGLDLLGELLGSALLRAYDAHLRTASLPEEP